MAFVNSKICQEKIILKHENGQNPQVPFPLRVSKYLEKLVAKTCCLLYLIKS